MTFGPIAYDGKSFRIILNSDEWIDRSWMKLQDMTAELNTIKQVSLDVHKCEIEVEHVNNRFHLVVDGHVAAEICEIETYGALGVTRYSWEKPKKKKIFISDLSAKHIAEYLFAFEQERSKRYKMVTVEINVEELNKLLSDAPGCFNGNLIFAELWTEKHFEMINLFTDHKIHSRVGLHLKDSFVFNIVKKHPNSNRVTLEIQEAFAFLDEESKKLDKIKEDACSRKDHALVVSFEGQELNIKRGAQIF